MLRLTTLVFAFGLVACGGDDSGEPLIYGAMLGEYDGHVFTPVFGFATMHNGAGLLAVGDGSVHCGTETDDAPPSGISAVLTVPLEVGNHGQVFVQMIRNVDSFEGVGANTGSVMITSVTEQSVTGELSFDHRDTRQRRFTVSGGFEVLHCAP